MATLLWKIKCPSCGKEGWTNADTAYNKTHTSRKCECGREYMAQLNVIETKLVR